MVFTDQQIEQLHAPLPPAFVQTRTQGGGRVSYIAGHEAINQANAIFGYDGWSYTVDRVETSAILEGASLLCTAVVTVSVGGVIRQDVGTDTIASNSKPDAFAMAYKTCVTDALKRALRSFGDQFGNSLYDKDADLAQERLVWLQREVGSLLERDSDAQAKMTRAVDSYTVRDVETLETMYTRLRDRLTERQGRAEEVA